MQVCGRRIGGTANDIFRCNDINIELGDSSGCSSCMLLGYLEEGAGIFHIYGRRKGGLLHRCDLTAMLCAIGMFRASGAMDWLCAILDPVTSLIGCPSEILPQAIMRSFSGGASEGMLADLLATYGTQSKIGRIASVAQGSTETTFYIIAVSMGSVGVSNARHSVAAGLLGDLGSLLAAVAIVNIMWF